MASQSKCDEKTVLTLLDVFGSCITDIFYNHLYDRAIAIHEKVQNKSLTECYRQVIKDYVEESSSPRFYTLLLNSLHHYVRMSTIYNTISYPDCITMYASMFVPQMYMASLTADQKMNILSMIMKNAVTSFANEIMDDHISCIIDDHGDHTNIEILQDAILKMLLQQRESNYQTFMNSQNNKVSKTTSKKNVSRDVSRDTATHKPSASQEVAPKALPQSLVKISNAFKKSVKDRMLLKKQNLQLNKKNKQLIQQFQELKTMFLSQLEVQKEQTKLVNELKERLESKVELGFKSKSESDSDSESSEPKSGGVSLVERNPSSYVNEYDDDIFSVQYVEA